jgi:hypothetical protein
VTDGDVELTRAWMSKRRARYPYGYDRTYRLIGAFNVPSYPYAVLVDSGGLVVWAGSAEELKPAMIKKHLKGSLTEPLWRWPAWAAEVKQAVAAGRYYEAVRLARKIEKAGESRGPSIVRRVETLIEARIKGLERALKNGDFLTVRERGARLEEALAGHQSWLRVVQVQDRLLADQSAQAILKAQVAVRSIRLQPMGTREQVKDSITRLEGLAKKHKGTYAAEQASRYAGFLKAVLRKR